MNDDLTETQFLEPYATADRHRPCSQSKGES